MGAASELKRWVVTGGTGFVGAALCEYARAMGHEVVVLSRSVRPPAGGVEYETWDPHRPGPWQRVVDGADAVVHLAGAGVMDERWTQARREEILESRVRSAGLLVDAIARASTRPRVFVSASAIGYYGTHAGAAELTEDAPPGDDFLARVCVAWEDAAKPACDLGVRVTHPRIGIVLGMGGGVVQKLLPSFRWGAGATLGTGRQMMSWVHVEDVVRALAFAVREPTMHGPFNLTAPEPVPAEAFTKAMASVLGRPAFLKVPSFALKLGLGAERAEGLLADQCAVPTRLLGAGFEFRFPTLAPALENLLVRA